MGGSDFDIYQTATGYVAVTNEVRRQILEALARKDRQLPDLVRITQKAKPTLSSVHMRDLLANKLVEEVAHPTDKRKKIYRLTARRIGSSNVPVEQLRSEIKRYVSRSPVGARLPLSASLDAIAHAPPRASDETLERQARRLGELAASLPTAPEKSDGASIASFLTSETIGTASRVEEANGTIEMDLDDTLTDTVRAERWARLVAAMIEGVARARGHDATCEGDARGERRIRLRLRDAKR